MKTTCLLIALACGLSFTAAATQTLLFGPAKVDLSCTAQALTKFGSKTNITGSVTNVTTVDKFSATNYTIDASSFLDLIGNSLNTNFPAGIEVLLEGAQTNYSLAVGDRTGTNILFLGELMQRAFEGCVNAGMQTASTNNQSVVTGNDTEAFSSEISFHYDDNGAGTKDTTHSNFIMNWLISSKSSRNIATGITTENVTITVTGGGQIRSGPPTIITGTIRAKTTGFIPNN